MKTHVLFPALLALAAGCSTPRAKAPAAPAAPAASAAPQAPAAPVAAAPATGRPEIRYYEIAEA
jgi:hypothetical protein